MKLWRQAVGIRVFTAAWLAIPAAAAFTGAASGQDEVDLSPDRIDAILGSYVEAYNGDERRETGLMFGLNIDEQWWTVRTGADGEPGQATRGRPDEPTFYYVLSEETLARLDSGELNSLTAMGKAYASDFAPLDVAAMEGFAPGADFRRAVLSLSFHFWNRGEPELIDYGFAQSRTVHGAQASVFYYQPGFRSAWFGVRPGQRLWENALEHETLFVITSGSGFVDIEGEVTPLSAGQAIFVPPGHASEYWTEGEEPMEGVILFFGEGA